ncbi:hypothetical protein CDD83_1515 [Cordyceps sp. RAO-2017]|nr:hypothetical protein CDD83_1515 [Cordyceps sp. RAO-2017]
MADPVAVRVAEASVEAIHAETVVRSYLASGVTPMDASVLILTSAFFFLNDREQLAWRAIGAAMRLLQELGHHSSDIWPSETGSEARDGAEKLFWAAYTMDRRLGYGLGFPFAIQDADIDHDPLFSVESPSTAYLKHMVSFCRIVSDVRYSSVEASEATRDYLDFRILGWRRNLPHVLQFGGKDDRFDPTVENRGHYRLRLTLYLRANQIRATIHMKWAVRAGPGTDLLNANNMAEVARDTIQILAGLADETDIYHSQHKTFNHYLETALSCLLLAVFCAQPADGASYLGDARAALDLVRRLSTDSTVSRRLFDKLRRVQDIVDRLIARDAAGLGGGHHHGAAAAAAAMDRLTVVRQQADVVTALEQADDRQRRRQRQEEEADDEAEEPAVGRDKTARVTTSAVPRATTGDALDPRPAPQPAGGLCPDTSQPADDYMSLMGFPELGKILDLYGDSFGF